MDWNPFYMTASGAAATLLGLLFIAVQFNINQFADDPGNLWRAIASSTYSIYALLFAIPMLFLIPSLDTKERSIIIFVAVSFGVYRAFRTWLPVWRGALHYRSERWWKFVRLFLGPLAAYGTLSHSAILLYMEQSSPAADQTIAIALVGLFAIALSNSWNLLVELTYERKQKEKNIVSPDISEEFH